MLCLLHLYSVSWSIISFALISNQCLRLSTQIIEMVHIYTQHVMNPNRCLLGAQFLGFEVLYQRVMVPAAFHTSFCFARKLCPVLALWLWGLMGTVAFQYISKALSSRETKITSKYYASQGKTGVLSVPPSTTPLSPSSALCEAITGTAQVAT